MVCGQRPKGIFCTLAGSHLTRLDREKTVHEYQRGQVIFYEGNPAGAIHCIYSGRVKLYKTGPKGDYQIIRLLGPGEIMGYRALLANEPCAATAEAVEPTTICTISKETLFDLLRQSSELAFQLLTKLAKELRVSEEQELVIAQETVRQRTARFLLFCCGGEKPKVGEPLKCPLSRAEMAQMVGTTPETFSRTLRYFALRGILRVTRWEIFIENPAALELLSRSL